MENSLLFNFGKFDPRLCIVQELWQATVGSPILDSMMFNSHFKSCVYIVILFLDIPRRKFNYQQTRSLADKVRYNRCDLSL